MEQRITQEQINQAKGISILDYLQTHEPQELKCIGRYYTLKSHDSMRIDSSTGNEYHHLALGGVSTVALERYVQKYPSIDKIVLCLDNDTAGVDASNRIYKEWKERGYTLRIVMPREGKDYNENLIQSTYYI